MSAPEYVEAVKDGADFIRVLPRRETATTRDELCEYLRLFSIMSPEEHRELSWRGGIASGERRWYLAGLRLEMIEALAGFDLARETREEYRRAIRRYVREEKKKGGGYDT